MLPRNGQLGGRTAPFLVLASVAAITIWFVINAASPRTTALSVMAAPRPAAAAAGASAATPALTVFTVYAAPARLVPPFAALRANMDRAGGRVLLLSDDAATLGRATALLAGGDGRLRVVDLRTAPRDAMEQALSSEVARIAEARVSAV